MEWQALTLSGTVRSHLARALEVTAASSALRECADLDAVLKSATELARELIGLERVAFYMRDPYVDTVVLRGTWGTGAKRETTSEHESFHEISAEHVQRMLQARATEPPCWCRQRALQFASDGGHNEVVGLGWIMVTPLLAYGHLVGVMYNDTALSGSAPDPGKQALAAVLCGLVSAEHATRVGPVEWKTAPPRPKRPTLTERAKRALDADLRRTGRDLAREFGVSGGFLAREFKCETGVSLVAYRNRARIERFQRAMREQDGHRSLKQAAFEAGFGSYAQFNRVHTKLVGAPATFSPDYGLTSKAGAKGAVTPDRAPTNEHAGGE